MHLPSNFQRRQYRPDAGMNEQEAVITEIMRVVDIQADSERADIGRSSGRLILMQPPK